jgi:hypothetical protein
VHGEQLVVLLVGQELLPGRASSARMSIAMLPPTKKKAIEVTRYSMPITL